MCVIIIMMSIDEATVKWCVYAYQVTVIRLWLIIYLTFYLPTDHADTKQRAVHLRIRVLSAS